MGNEEIFSKLERENLKVDEQRCESSSSASSNLLEEYGEPKGAHDLIDDEEKTEEKKWRVGPCYLICLTIGTGGLQVIWTAIMGHGSIYLSSLGLPPHVISFIWLAGPLSGAVIHPYISVLSDRSRNSWGQRKPYILLGTIFTIIFMIFLPWTGSFIDHLFRIFEKSPQGTVALVVKGIVAASLIWALNIAIQPVQMGLRALICEACPSPQKVQATAYASVITGIGSIFGYASGLLNLPHTLPWLGDTQFKCLCVIASLALSLTVAVTLAIIDEKQVVFDEDEDVQDGVSFFDVFRQIYRKVVYMPKDMMRICQVQFFAWSGWFPFLFYITTYLAGIYENDILAQPEDDVFKQSQSYLHDRSIRYGTFAMVLFSIVALLSNFLLPLIVSFPEQDASTVAIQLSGRPTTSCEAIAEPKNCKDVRENNLWRCLKWAKVSKIRPYLEVKWLTIPRAWIASHFLTFTILFSTSLTRSPSYSMFLVSLLGISWAVTQWAPLALASVFIETQQSHRPIPSRRSFQNCSIDLPATISDDVERGHEEVSAITGDLRAGAVMGVYNIAIATPQIIAALGSSMMFGVLRWWEIDETEVVGWVIRIWGLASLVAAWLAAGI